jgi:hypothetical protein
MIGFPVNRVRWRADHFGWREAIVCGVLLGLAITAFETLVQPARDASILEHFAFSAQLAFSFVLSGTLLALLAVQIERRLRGAAAVIAAILVVPLAAVTDVLICRFIWWMMPGVGVDAMLGFVPNITEHVVHLLWIFGFYGGAYLLAYALFRRSSRLRQQIGLVELARRESENAIDAARVEDLTDLLRPSLLLASIAEIGRRYAVLPDQAERLLDRQVAFLRAAMPQLRTRSSDLRSEVELVSLYVELSRELGQFHCRFDVSLPPLLPLIPFPPLVLLPLLDDLATVVSDRAHLTLVVQLNGGSALLVLGASDPPDQSWVSPRLRRRLELSLSSLGGTLSHADQTAHDAILTLSVPRPATAEYLMKGSIGA